jgi:hypothetical protein
MLLAKLWVSPVCHAANDPDALPAMDEAAITGGFSGRIAINDKGQQKPEAHTSNGAGV